MKPDSVLEALDKVAVKFGKPHPRGLGFGFNWEETEVMEDFLLAVVEDYKEQLLRELERHDYKGAALVVRDYEYR